jgi:putative oxidoreductase
MKIVGIVARVLLGLMFVVFGLNGIHPFMPPPPPPAGLAGQFAGALMASHYMQVVSFLMVLGGLLLLVNRYVPLGLTILGPIIVNILLFHLLMAPKSIQAGLVATVLWFIVFASVKAAFAGLFVAKVPG